MKRAGFTLIEMIMVLFLGTLLMLTLFTIYDWHTRLYNYEQAQVRVTTANRNSLDTIQNFVMQATQVLDTGTVNSLDYTTSSTTLVLQLPALDSANNVVSGQYDKTVFYSSGSGLYQNLEPAGASSRKSLNKILNDSLQSISFVYDTATASSASKVTVSIQSSQPYKNQTISSNLLQNLYLINK